MNGVYGDGHEQKVIRSGCEGCHGGCGILVHVRDGRVVKVEGDPENPNNKGFLCPIGLAGTQILYHPDRITHPMKRVGERGEGRWQRISWDEAIDTIGGKLRAIRDEHGPLAIAAANGTARACAIYVMHFLSNIGSPNRLGHPHICSTPQWACYGLTYGRRPGPHFEESRCIAAFGSNVTHTRVRPRRTFCEAYGKGARIIAVDPYLTPIASKADIWLQIRPGTDCAMALAWLNVIIGEGLYDRDFVDRWGYGFDRLAQHVKQYTPQWAEEITWVPAGKIAAAARLYATTKPASLVIGVAPEFGVNNTQTIRALTMLPGVTGNIDKRGGNIFWFSPIGDRAKVFTSCSLTRDDLAKAVARFPLLAIGNPTAGHAGWRAMVTGEPYPIKAVLFHASNPMVSDENPRGLVYQALKKVDFVSVMDFFMTPTAEMADIVLPAATWFEKDDIMVIYSGNWWSPIVTVQKAVEPVGESRDDADVLIDITKRMGLDYGFNSKREILDWFVQGLAGDFTELAQKGWADIPQEFERYEKGLLTPDGKPGFHTSTGKVEFYSQILEEMGLDPLPVYREPVESPYSSPALAEAYPLILTTGTRSPVYMHSQWRQIPWLREIHPDPLVKIHPRTARDLGIQDGDWVSVESPHGSCRHRAFVTLGIDPRVVQTEASWWFPEEPAPGHGVWEANSNMLVNSEPPWDPGFGATSGRSLLCKITKV